jgi:hypothetical protein
MIFDGKSSACNLILIGASSLYSIYLEFVFVLEADIILAMLKSHWLYSQVLRIRANALDSTECEASRANQNSFQRISVLVGYWGLFR